MRLSDLIYLLDRLIIWPLLLYVLLRPSGIVVPWTFVLINLGGGHTMGFHPRGFDLRGIDSTGH